MLEALFTSQNICYIYPFYAMHLLVLQLFQHVIVIIAHDWDPEIFPLKGAL